MMRVWHYWMVTRWTVAPEHYSLEIRPLAAIFTLLLQKKSWGKKKKKKGNPEKTQPQLPKNRQPETLSSASLVFTESITSSCQDGVPTRDPWTGFLTDVAWWKVWSSQHHPAFARQPARKKTRVWGEKVRIFFFFFLMSKPQSHWGTADFFNCSLKARTSPFLELGCSSRQGHWMASLHQFPRKRHIDGFF